MSLEIDLTHFKNKFKKSQTDGVEYIHVHAVAAPKIDLQAYFYQRPENEKITHF